MLRKAAPRALKSTRSVVLFVFLAFMLGVCHAGPAIAQDAAIVGWGDDGLYNAHYDKDQVIKFKGFFVSSEAMVPLEGMAQGLVLTLKLRDSGEDILVHIGPMSATRFLPPLLKEGDLLNLKGCVAFFNGKKVIMAARMKINELIDFKVRRTSDGKPYWTMDKEELIQEKINQ